MQHKCLIDDNDPDISYVLENHPDYSPDLVFDVTGDKVTLKKQSIKIYSVSETSRLEQYYNLELLSKYLHYLHAESVKKSNVQGETPKTLISFCLSLFGETDVRESLTGETKRLYIALLDEFEKCDHIYKSITDISYYSEHNELTEYANNLSTLLISFLDRVDIPSYIKIKSDKAKRKKIKAHFARGLFIEHAIRVLAKIDVNTSTAYVIDRAGFIGTVFSIAAFQVLTETDKELKDHRSWIKSPDAYAILNMKNERFQGTKTTNSSVRTIMRNLYIKLVIYYLERNWDHVSALYSTPEKPFAYTIENLLLVLISICDDVFTCNSETPIAPSTRPKLESLATKHEKRVMLRTLNKIIGKYGPLLPEPTNNENAI
ncbi:hypothetical protein [Aeromonas rivipollensis]|uniref:hypothetical protein n=1 Tax=Aeromonas rivipollensis TaxID=948519 RepID=UPI003D25B3C2